jgi:conjugal transfer/type IV secretion protein DotA/TraY
VPYAPPINNFTIQITADRHIVNNYVNLFRRPSLRVAAMPFTLDGKLPKGTPMFDLLAKPDLEKTPDIAYGWIVELFPTSDASPYGQAFATFSGMLTFLGSLFLAWHVLQGIVLSAYSGKVLGEKFHQIWAPLRVVLGMGLLVPISGGFSSIHLLLRDVVGVAAVNMGNAPIKAYIAAVTAPKEGTIVDVASMRGRFVFNDFLDKEICNAVHKGLSEGTWSSFFGTAGTVKEPTPSQPPVIGTTNYNWDYGSCGSIGFNLPKTQFVGVLEGAETQYQAFATSRMQATASMITAIRSKINKTKLGKYFTNHDITEMKSDQILAQLRTEGLVPAGLGTFADEQSQAWNDKLAAKAGEVYKFVMTKNATALTTKINDYGFMAAGSFERALSKASAIGVSLANAAPEKKAATLSKEYEAPYLAAVGAVLNIPNLTDENKGTAMSGVTSNDEAISSFMNAISPSIAAMKAGRASTTGDPLGDMISFGHTLLTAYESLLGVVVLMKAAAHVAAAAADGATMTVANAATLGFGAMLAKAATTGVAEIIDYMISWFSPIMTIMLLVGILHAFVLPMLPMMMVFVMGVSWLIMFLEASIAGVLWAFVFIRMDGQEFIDRSQAPGATLLFNLFLRPAIGMLAFVGGLMLLPKLMNSLSILWDDSFNSQTSPDILWIVQWIVGIVMYTWMQWHLTLRLFGLIPTIADRVGSWMGFQSHGYNDGQETTAAIGAAVAAGGAGKMVQRRPQQKIDKSQNQGISELKQRVETLEKDNKK